MVGGFIMSKRIYTHVQEKWPVIQEMRLAGKTRREIAQALNLPVIKTLINIITRQQRKEREMTIPKRMGRPRKHPIKSLELLEKENKHLQMEN